MNETDRMHVLNFFNGIDAFAYIVLKDPDLMQTLREDPFATKALDSAIECLQALRKVLT